MSENSLPTTLRVDPRLGCGTCAIVVEDGTSIESTSNYGLWDGHEYRDRIRDEIVRRWNAYPALLAALERIRDGMADDRAYRDAARTAIAQARGEPESK